jgi:hypothetical protein
MRLLLISLFMGFFITAYAEPIPANKDVSCTIESLKKQYILGQSPKFNFKVKNHLEKPILLVKILDGSDCDFRQPQGSFQVFGPDGKAIQYGIGRCGNTNPLEKSDFVWIKPGEEMKLAQYGLSLGHAQFKKAGIYKIKFNYSTLNDDFRKWTGGPMGPEGIKKVKNQCGELFESRKKITLTAEVEIEIVEKQ